MKSNYSACDLKVVFSLIKISSYTIKGDVSKRLATPKTKHKIHFKNCVQPTFKLQVAMTIVQKAKSNAICMQHCKAVARMKTMATFCITFATWQIHYMTTLLIIKTAIHMPITHHSAESSEDTVQNTTQLNPSKFNNHLVYIANQHSIFQHSIFQHTAN